MAGKQVRPKQTPQIRTPHRVAFAVIVPLGVLLLFGGGLFAYGSTFSGKIMPGVHVAGLDIGGLPVANARKILSDAAAAYLQRGVDVTLASHSWVTPLSSLGVEPDVDATLDQARIVGGTSAVERTLHLRSFAERKDVAFVVNVNSATLASFVSETQKEFGTPMENPHIVLDGGVFVIRDGVEGMNVVASEQTSAQLLVASANLDVPKLELSFERVLPAISTDDLAATRQELEDLSHSAFHLTFQSRRFDVDTDTIKTWLEQGYDFSKGASNPLDGIVVSLNEPVVAAYLQELNTKVGLQPKETFGYESPEKGEYAYKNSQGRDINIKATENEILSGLLSHETKSVQLTMEVLEPIIKLETVAAPKPTGKAISVDITKQTAYAFEDGKLVFWTRASTGKGDRTIPGEWKVYYKNPDQTMKGPGYNLPHVKWVLAYNGDFTLHGTYWHTKFGQPMSHGCTNLSETDAKWFYDWAPIGTPVVIYKSPKV